MEDFPFHLLDIVLLSAIVWSATIAFSRGVVREMAASLGLLAALAITVFGFPLFKPLIDKHLAIPVLANALTLTGAFAVLLVVLNFAFRSLRAKAEAAQSNGLDRSMGFIFGAARGGVLACLAYLFISWIVPVEQQPSWMTSFQSRPLLQAGGEVLKNMVPGYTQKGVATDVAAVQKFGTDVRLAVQRLADPEDWSAPEEQTETAARDTEEDNIQRVLSSASAKTVRKESNTR